MGREVRRVPQDWQHPRDSEGKFRPLHKGEDVKREYHQWWQGWESWQQGKHPDADKDRMFSDWEGPPPNPDDYMPSWPADVATHYQMYENTSEGTPISPVFATPEELARWCADSGASYFGDITATYEQWLYVAQGGPGLIICRRLNE